MHNIKQSDINLDNVDVDPCEDTSSYSDLLLKSIERNSSDKEAALQALHQN